MSRFQRDGFPLNNSLWRSFPEGKTSKQKLSALFYTMKLMKKYEILLHLADLKIRAFGGTKNELFSNALFGMAESQGAKKLKTKVKRLIKIKSLDLSALLVDFLSEALYLGQANKEVYFRTKFKKFTDTELEADLIGNKVESFGEEIKAVTYHGLETKKNLRGLWEATILFDI